MQGPCTPCRARWAAFGAGSCSAGCRKVASLTRAARQAAGSRDHALGSLAAGRQGLCGRQQQWAGAQSPPSQHSDGLAQLGTPAIGRAVSDQAPAGRQGLSVATAAAHAVPSQAVPPAFCCAYAHTSMCTGQGWAAEAESWCSFTAEWTADGPSLLLARQRRAARQQDAHVWGSSSVGSHLAGDCCSTRGLHPGSPNAASCDRPRAADPSRWPASAGALRRRPAPPTPSIWAACALGPTTRLHA